MIAPLSIPSPDPAWQALQISAWLESTFGWDLPFTFRITTYAICILIGAVLGGILIARRLKARGADPGLVWDIALWGFVLGLIGARAWHVATHPDDYFFEGAEPFNVTRPGHVFAIWEGGNAIFGALVGGAVGVYIVTRYSGLRFWTAADIIAPGLLLAQAVGRLGNWFNHELFGLPTDLPWGLEIESSNPAYPVGLPEGTLFHPTFLYEMIWNLVGVAVILFVEHQRRLQWGKVFALYLIWYGAGRIWFEWIRIDPSELFLGIRLNVWGAFAALVLGLVILIAQTRQHPGLEPSPYRPGREPAAEDEVDSDETYSDSDDSGDDATDAERTPATSGAGTKSS